MGFTIQQVINLHSQGFTADQISAFEKSISPQVQPMPQVQQVQQVQQMPPAQNIPMETPRSGAADTSLQMLNLVRQMQNNALANDTGLMGKPMTAESAGLEILGRGEEK